jgi:hypothetical protein
MSSKVLITSDFATPADVAKQLRIPPARVAELRALMLEVRGSGGAGDAKRRPARRGLKAAARAKKK